MNSSIAAVEYPIKMTGVFPPMTAWVPSSRSTTILNIRNASIMDFDLLMSAYAPITAVPRLRAQNRPVGPLKLKAPAAVDASQWLQIAVGLM